MDEGDGMNSVGGDPMVQTMAASKAVDMAFQKLATLYPDAIDPLSQLQMSFRQLIAGLMTMQSQPGMGMGGPGMPGMGGGMGGGMGAPNIVPPLPMQSGATSGAGMGIGL